MALQETLLGNHYSPIFNGYKEMISEEGQGCALLIKRGYPCQRIQIPSKFESITVGITIQKEPYIISNVYLSPNKRFTMEDMDSFYQNIMSIKPKPKNIIILGDFNARHLMWGDSTTNPRGRILEDFMENNQIYYLNDDEPTHISSNGSMSNIDLTLCNRNLITSLRWEVLDEPYGSDHFPIKITFNQEKNTPVTPKWVLKRADWESFTELMQLQQKVNDFATIDEAATYFIDRIHLAARGSIPKSKKMAKPPIPWWNKECENAVKARKSAYRRYKRTKSQLDRIIYKRRTAKARYILKQSRRSSWRDYVSSLNSSSTSTQIWNKIAKISKKKTPPVVPTLKIDNKILLDSEEVANIIAGNLSDLTSGSRYSPHFRILKADAEANAPDFFSTNEEAYNDLISLDELLDALKQAKSTAPGNDEVPFDMLTHLSEDGKQFLLDLFNRIWIESNLPTGWHEATVLPLLKPGKEPSSPESYRPISLTCCTCKLLEKIINHRLVWYLETNDIITPTQFGFRKLRATTDPMLILEREIREAFNANRHLIGVFFDIEKAYDTTWRHGILREMHSMGLRGRLPSFIQDFLTDRHFRVRVGGKFSEWFQQLEGVPQGSVLSVACFVVAFNGIVNCLPLSVRNLIYVDDLTIYCTSTRIPFMARQLQIAINAIATWAENRGFKFSTKKTVAVKFTRVPGAHEPLELKIYDKEIKFEKEVRYLGLIFDQKLTWASHILNVKGRCLKDLNILRMLANTSWGADRQVMLQLYSALVLPKLMYGSPAYGSAASSHLKKLDSVHHEAIRISIGAFRTSPVESLYCESGVRSLWDQRSLEDLKYLSRLKRDPKAPAYKILTETRHTIPNPRSGLSRSYGLRVSEDLTQLRIGNFQVTPVQIPLSPTWRATKINCCMGPDMDKRENPASLFAEFHSHVEEHHSGSEHIFTDGSKTEVGVGYAAVQMGEAIMGALPDKASIFTAELKAIEQSLISIADHHKFLFTIFSDSRSALQALGNLHPTHPLVRNIRSNITTLSGLGKTINFCWVPSHCGIAGNERADECAKRAGMEDATVFSLPHSDYYLSFKQAVDRRWRERWRAQEGNKLLEIKEDIRSWKSSCQPVRRYSTLLTRLRIGHTRYTHGHLMEGTPGPYCDHCNTQISVKHFMVECPLYEAKRRALYDVHGRYCTMEKVLGEPPRGEHFNMTVVIDYVRDINLIYKI